MRWACPPENRKPRADEGIEAGGEGGDGVVDTRGGQGAPELFVGGLGAREREVGADGVVDEVGLLRDDADAARALRGAEVSHIDAAEQHAAAAGIGQAGEQQREGGFAAAGMPHHDGRGVRGDADIDAHRRRGFASRVGIGDIFDAEGVICDLAIARVFRFLDLGFEVEAFEDAAKKRHGAHPLRADVEQAGHRAKDLGL